MIVEVQANRTGKAYTGQMYSWSGADVRLRFWTATRSWLLITGPAMVAFMVTKDQVRQIFKMCERPNKITVWM